MCVCVCVRVCVVDNVSYLHIYTHQELDCVWVRGACDVVRFLNANKCKWQPTKPVSQWHACATCHLRAALISCLLHGHSQVVGSLLCLSALQSKAACAWCMYLHCQKRFISGTSYFLTPYVTLVVPLRSVFPCTCTWCLLSHFPSCTGLYSRSSHPYPRDDSLKCAARHDSQASTLCHHHEQPETICVSTLSSTYLPVVDGCKL